MGFSSSTHEVSNISGMQTRSGFIPATSSILSRIRFILDSLVVSGQRPFRSTLATQISLGNFLFSCTASMVAEALEAPNIPAPKLSEPAPKPREEFLIKFLLETFFLLVIKWQL